MTTPLFLSVGKATYTFTRRAGNYDDYGRWSDGSPTTFTIKCNIQPNAAGKMTKLLPEGDRSKYSIFIITDGISQSLRTSKEGSALLKGDEVTWNNDVYEIREVNLYNLGVLDSYQCLAVRKEVA
jgi:hypothetical protein